MTNLKRILLTVPLSSSVLNTKYKVEFKVCNKMLIGQKQIIVTEQCMHLQGKF